MGQKVITRNCNGYLPSQVAFYLQNVHIQPRKIYLSIIAENVEQSKYVSGSESGKLTDSGHKYSHDLAFYLRQQRNSNELVSIGKEILILTGTTKIHRKTVRHLVADTPVKYTTLLNELRGGDLHGLEKAEMKVCMMIKCRMLSFDLVITYVGTISPRVFEATGRQAELSLSWCGRRILYGRH